jgi:hypothetical protein
MRYKSFLREVAKVVIFFLLLCIILICIEYIGTTHLYEEMFARCMSIIDISNESHVAECLKYKKYFNIKEYMLDTTAIYTNVSQFFMDLYHRIVIALRYQTDYIFVIITLIISFLLFVKMMISARNF